MARWATITTQKPGSCQLCGGEIEIGETVRWSSTHGLEHPGGNRNGMCGLQLGTYVKSVEELAVNAQAELLPKELPEPGPGKSTDLKPGEREMASKFRGRCHVCKQSFPAGTVIVWAKASGARHATCEAS